MSSNLTNCTPASATDFPSDFFSLEDRKRGYITLHILLAICAFVLLAVVCHEFFVPAIKRACVVCGIESSVAGATLVSAGASLPQLAVALYSVFVTKNEIGVGSIMGAALFNNFFIIGACGLFAGRELQLDWWPLFRDCTAYGISATVLVLVMQGSQVTWYQGMAMIILYALYILLMAFNSVLHRHANTLLDKIKARIPCSVRGCQCCKRCHKKNDGECTHLTEMKDIKNREALATEDVRTEDDENETEYRSILSPPKETWKRVFWVLALPMLVLTFVCIPDFRRPGCWQHLYIVTFIVSILFIGGASYVLLWMITIIGDTFSVPKVIMGLTLIAFGGSLPDLLNAVFIARDGDGEMAAANALGSNVFEILFCLGFPWFVKALVDGKPVGLTEDVNILLSLLVVTAIVVYVILWASRWLLNKKSGIVLLFVYLLFFLFDVFYDMRLALPMCGS